MPEQKIKYIRTKAHIRQNNRVLRLAKRTKRVFVIFVDRNTANGGEGSAKFVKKGRIYHPDFDCDLTIDFPWKFKYKPPEYEKTLEELINDGFNLRYAGHHGDGRDAYWNNTGWNMLDMVVQMRLLEGRQ